MYSNLCRFLSRAGLPALVLWSAATLSSCRHDTASAQDGEPADTEQVRLHREYARARAEMELARGEKAYLEIDPARPRLILKLKGAVVFTVPITIAPDDSGAVDDFVDDLFGRQVISFVRERYLYAGSEKVPDSVLAIISEAVGADPALMQRYLPERFIVEWEGGVVLDVRTTIKGQPVSRLGNIMAEIRQIIKRPFSTQLKVDMDAEAALTLYSVCEPGTPTILTIGR